MSLTTVLTGCHKKAPPAAGKQLPPAEVTLQTVEDRKRPAFEEVVGTIRARLRASIEAKVSGRIDKMLVSPGQSVEAGQLLAQLDAREIEAKLEQAVAMRQLADRDLKRFGALLQQQAVTQQEYDAVEARHRVALAAVAEAETMLGYAKITAPFKGVITRKLADVGDLAAPGRPMIEIEDPTALRLEVDVPEALAARASMGDRMNVRIPAFNAALEGTVSEVSPSADPNSRTLRVKLDLPETQGLMAGQFGRMALPVGESSALRAPVAAVVRRGQLEMVFVVATDRAQLRLVKTGKTVGQEVELVSGVTSGERIVTSGADGLTDGQPVSVKR